MNCKNIIIHCQPSMLDLIKYSNLKWSYSPVHGEEEIDVFYEDYEDLDDEDLIDIIGLDYDQVNCIELDEVCLI